MDYKKQQEIFLPVMINLVRDMQREIEQDGLVASADEIINRLEVINESNRITQHND